MMLGIPSRTPAQGAEGGTDCKWKALGRVFLSALSCSKLTCMGKGGG